MKYNTLKYNKIMRGGQSFPLIIQLIIVKAF